MENRDYEVSAKNTVFAFRWAIGFSGRTVSDACLLRILELWNKARRPAAQIVNLNAPCSPSEDTNQAAFNFHMV